MMTGDELASEVSKLLGGDHGHGMDHVLRVRDMAVRFAEQEGADVTIVELASLLHDVDDYKLFGEASAKQLTNARRLLDAYTSDEDGKAKVLEIIRTMGYNKYLEGVRPGTLECMIVSDADMCDAIGAEGILRTHAYALSKGNPFFDSDTAPDGRIKTATQYRGAASHSVQHFFDKLLIIPSIMLTNAGKEEAALRGKIMVDFLHELFREESADEWKQFLDDFTRRQVKTE